MFPSKLVTLLLLSCTMATQAQSNFTYSPAQPKPGDVITFTYDPAGDIANTLMPVEAVVYQVGLKGNKADDVTIEKTDGKYAGTITTDPAMNFVYLAFTADKKFDNNFNEGYTINLFENNKPVKGSYATKSVFFQGMGAQQAGVEANAEKAMAAMEKEFELYPESRKTNLYSYVRLKAQLNKSDAAKIIQSEIEILLKNGLKEESDYSTLENLYSLGKFPEQSKFIASVRKEKFPNGTTAISTVLTKFNAEKDIAKKKVLLAELVQKAETGGENWQGIKGNLDFYRSQIANVYIANKDWANVKKALAESGIKDKSYIATTYNSAAWEMQKASTELTLAEEYSRTATNIRKDMMRDKNAKKPDYLTRKQFEKSNENTYAQFADTYAMVMFRMGNYKKGVEYAKEAAITINKGADADLNNTYSLLAEKALPKKQYVKDIEQFVKDGKSTSEMKDILKRAKGLNSDASFEDYYTSLQKEAYMKMVEDLRKTILNTNAASFALLDLDGKKVQLAELKGKVVIVDFWATWCGPCKASFPSMQKMVTKYKDDPNVKFVFIDTWERGEDKKKDAQEFITKNKYTFHVLQDNEDKVVADYKVGGIPTKFVIDKQGTLRFKAIGWNGSDEKFIQELTAMIDMASNANGDKALK